MKTNTLLKWLCCLIMFFIILRAHGQSETYYVIHVKGVITNTTTSKHLKVGDVIKSTDKIEFNPTTAKAVLMSVQQGRFTLGNPSKITTSAGGEFISFVKNTLIPATSVGHLSTRGDATPPCTNDLKKTLGNESFIFPGDKAVLCLDRNSYLMNENRFFIYRTHNGDKETNYMIPFSGDSLFIEQDKFHNDTGATIERKADIYYYDKTQNSSVKITTIIPVYVNAEELKAEFVFLIQLYKKQNLSQRDLLNKLTDHVEEVYNGRTDEHMLERWLMMKGITIQ